MSGSEGLIFVVTLVAGVALGHYLADDSWQAKWDKHIEADKVATASFQARIDSDAAKLDRIAAKNESDGQAKIQSLNADIDERNATNARLLVELDKINGRLSVSKGETSACITEVGKANAEFTRVLANVLDMANSAAGTLAVEADESRTRNQNCANFYDEVKAESEGK